MTNEQSQFITKVYNAIGSQMSNAGLLNSVTIAQAILESGWGSSELFVKANNTFGLNNYNDNVTKNYGHYYCNVPQEVNGVWSYRVEDMCAFTDLSQAVECLMRWYTMRAKYQPIINCKDYKYVCNFLTGKYATDSKYGSKLINLIETYNLTQYDEVNPAKPKTSHWYIQSGAYRDKRYAVEHCNRLSKKYIPCVLKFDGQLYRVQCGEYEDKSLADNYANYLNEQGLGAIVKDKIEGKEVAIL